MYFHNLEPCERGDDNGPRCPANLRSPALMLVAERDADLQADPFAFDIFELLKRLPGDIDSMLDIAEDGGKVDQHEWEMSGGGEDLRRRTRLE